ncbi:hypothetical protein BDM02DRAFT_3123744 [Thelephora ganbajun]|uniref:Uncharacterized protein n=1 Tax=Thelephora ganbajun TaxID=370292 RepID=A0ACB6Z0N8_THEGA|nr:hypothetical protein BDM02DRAFT_3123744 [Thelephora ganbajun]
MGPIPGTLTRSGLKDGQCPQNPMPWQPVGGPTLYRKVNFTGLVWVGGTLREADGGVGVVEVDYS